MKTDDLITLLARDATPVKRSALPLRLVLPVLAGVVAALAILVPWLGIRPDLAEAAAGATYWMKTIYTFGLGIAGFALVERLSRPGARSRLGWAMIALWAVLAVVFAAAQLISTPADQMQSAFMGSTWDKCPWRILLLSLPGLALTLWTMRRFAPTRPTLAGAAAGLLAGGLAATVYGLHCQETAMPFVAIFYSLGIMLSAATGALIGSRVLRW